MKERHSIICAAYAFLIRNDQILLLRRFNTGYEDGNYSVPAGHVEKDETVLSTLIREVREEIGVTLTMNDTTLAHVMHRMKTDKNDERLDFFFICTNWQGNVKNCEEEKCDDLHWFDIDHLPENIIPYIKEAMENALTKKIYSEL